jgi:hypothetical protein
LRTNTFSLASVVISAWLVIKLRKDSVLLSVDNLALLLEGGHLPPDEGVVEWVDACGDE